MISCTKVQLISRVIGYLLVPLLSGVSFASNAAVTHSSSNELSSSCRMNLRELNFGTVYKPGKIRQSTAFQIVCGSTNLPDGTIRYKVSLLPTPYGRFSRIKLTDGISYSLYADPSYHRLLGNDSSGGQSINGYLTIRNHHGKTAWIPVYGMLRIKHWNDSATYTQNLTTQYQLQYVTQ